MKTIKWILGIALSLLFSVLGWNSIQLYKLNADNEIVKMNIRLLDSNLNKSDKINAEKNKNCNKRIDNVVDNQRLINNQNTQEHKIIMKKLDKIYNYQIINNKNFKEYINASRYVYNINR